MWDFVVIEYFLGVMHLWCNADHKLIIQSFLWILANDVNNAISKLAFDEQKRMWALTIKTFVIILTGIRCDFNIIVSLLRHNFDVNSSNMRSNLVNCGQ